MPNGRLRNSAACFLENAENTEKNKNTKEGTRPLSVNSRTVSLLPIEFSLSLLVSGRGKNFASPVFTIILLLTKLQKKQMVGQQYSAK